MGRGAQENLWVQVCKWKSWEECGSAKSENFDGSQGSVPHTAGELESGGQGGVLPCHAHRLGEDAWAHS